MDDKEELNPDMMKQALIDRWFKYYSNTEKGKM